MDGTATAPRRTRRSGGGEHAVREEREEREERAVDAPLFLSMPAPFDAFHPLGTPRA